MAKALKKLFRPDSLSGLQIVQLIRYGSLFLISIVLAKSALSTESIGKFESLLLFTGALTFFWVTGIIQSLLPLFKNSKSFEDQSSGKKSPEIFNAFISLMAFSLLGGLLVLLIGESIANLIDIKLGRNLSYFVAAFVIFQSPSALVEYIYLLNKEARKLVRYGWLVFGFQFLLVSTAALLNLPLNWVLTAFVGSAFLRFVYLLVVISEYSRIQFSWKFQVEHMKLGIPILVSVFLSGSAHYVDGFIIKAYYDESTFAVFRYGARELPLVALLAHALSNGIIPVFTEKGIHAGLKSLKERSTVLAKWLFPVTLFLILTSYLLFPLIYDERFIASAGIFNVYLLLILTRLLFPQAIFIALKKTKVLMLAAGFELLVNVGLSLIFVQYFGLLGVAFATLIAYSFERVFLMVYLRVILGIRVSQYTNIIRHLLWSLVVLLAFILVESFLKDAILSLFS